MQTDQTDHITTQLNVLSMQDIPKKTRKPRKPKNKQNQSTKTSQETATRSTFRSEHDQHALFPSALDMAPHQSRRQHQDPSLIRYVPYDSFPDTSYRSSSYRTLNPRAEDYPPPVAPTTFHSMHRHPSSFFVPSYASHAPPPPPVSQRQPPDFYTQPISFFSQPFQQPEIHPQRTLDPRRSARQAARQSHSQQEDARFFRSDLFQAPPPTHPIQDPEIRTPRPSDKRARTVGKLLRPTPSLPYLVNSMVTSPRLDQPKSLLVILDLNGVLAFRKKRTKGYHPRPNLDPFLDYLFANHHVMIWSSGMPENVERIMEKMLTPEQRERLVAIWSRDKLRIPPNLFAEKVQVYKQLSWVWEDPTLRTNAPLGGWSQRDTVLVDDSIDKAAAEPHNLIQVDEFINSAAQKENTTLLEVIDYLERIRWHENVSAEMRVAPFVARKA